jgi:sugar lactone lactonase YvrE
MGGLMRRAAVAGGAAVMLLGPAAGVFGAAGAKAGTRPAAGARAVISTVAGGVGGPAPATSVSIYYGAPGSFTSGFYGGGMWPCSVAFAGGQVYIADNWSVRTVSPKTDQLRTFAGTGAGGPLGDGGPAVRASVQTCPDDSAPTAGGTLVDPAGNVVIADSFNNRIRVVAHTNGSFYGREMTAGHIYTIAGTGAAAFSGDGGPATAAALNEPTGMALDGAGNLVFADTGNNRLRVVARTTGSFYGLAMTAGHIYTIAGTGAASFSGDGGPATHAAIWTPDGLAIDGAGNIVIVAADNERVRVIAHRTGTFYAQAMKAGDIYTVAGNGETAFSGDGGPATRASLYYPTGLAVDSAGNLMIADTLNNRVRVVAAQAGTFYQKAMKAGDIYTIAGNGRDVASGDGGPATRAGLHPDSIAFDGSGNLVISDAWNGLVRVVAAHTGTFYQKAMKAGDIYTIAGNGVGGASGWAGPATRAELANPQSVTLDSTGNLLITDPENGLVRVVAARTGTFYRRAMTGGHIYTVAGGGLHLGDKGPATQANLSAPEDVAVDSDGNLVIADSGHFRVRVVAARTGTLYGQAMTAGDIYTIAGNGTHGYTGDGGPATRATLWRTNGVTLDGAGNVLIADTGSSVIRVVAARTGTFYGQAMTAGDIYTIAGNGTHGYTGDGGPASTAELNRPDEVTVDGAGNLVIADTNNNRARVVAVRTGTFYGQAMTAGDIYTIAGDGTAGYSGDGGPASTAELNSPERATTDAAGNIVIADTSNNRIRVMATHTGTFYGQAMTAGDIYTIAGTSRIGFSGDSGPAGRAELNQPDGVAIDGAGNLLIADAGNRRIREVAK